VNIQRTPSPWIERVSAYKGAELETPNFAPLEIRGVPERLPIGFLDRPVQLGVKTAPDAMLVSSIPGGGQRSSVDQNHDCIEATDCAIFIAAVSRKAQIECNRYENCESSIEHTTRSTAAVIF
jgi:hypothetical protein